MNKTQRRKYNKQLHDVKTDYRLLAGITDQTYQLCVSAIRANPFAIKYVNKQTLKLCTAAVKRNGIVLCYINDEFRTPDVLLAAVKSNGYALKNIPKSDQTQELCMAAVKSAVYSVKYVELDDADIYTEAVDLNSMSLKYIDGDKQTYDLCMRAICNNARAFPYVKNITNDFCEDAVQKNVRTFEYMVNYRTEKICWYALLSNIWWLECISCPTIEMYYYAIRQNGLALKFVLDKKENFRNKLDVFYDLCQIALYQAPFQEKNIVDTNDKINAIINKCVFRTGVKDILENIEPKISKIKSARK